jgi:hypothetical protein
MDGPAGCKTPHLKRRIQMSGNWLKRIALVCMTPEVDAQEHSEALPSYGIHRIQAAIVANPAFANTEVRIIQSHTEIFMNAG